MKLCPNCASPIWWCDCPKTWEVYSGSHAIGIHWYGGSFTATSADRPSLVSESQKAYLADWPHGSFRFKQQGRVLACADCGNEISYNERHECKQMKARNKRAAR